MIDRYELTQRVRLHSGEIGELRARCQPISDQFHYDILVEDRMRRNIPHSAIKDLIGEPRSDVIRYHVQEASHD